MAKTVEWTVPMSDKGMQGSGWYVNAPIRELPKDTEIDLRLEFQHYTKGRSAVGFIFKDDKEGLLWNMTLKNMTDMLKETIIDRGHVSGTFGFTKQGSTVSLKYLRNI